MHREISSREDLHLIVSDFYEALLADKALSQFFDKFRDPQTLEHHLHDLSAFWEHSLFYRGSYKKNVMGIHLDVHQKNSIQSAHMDRWLELFHGSVDKNFGGTQAERLKNKATSIATIMRMKLELKK